MLIHLLLLLLLLPTFIKKVAHLKAIKTMKCTSEETSYKTHTTFIRLGKKKKNILNMVFSAHLHKKSFNVF